MAVLAPTIGVYTAAQAPKVEGGQCRINHYSNKANALGPTKNARTNQKCRPMF